MTGSQFSNRYIDKCVSRDHTSVWTLSNFLDSLPVRSTNNYPPNIHQMARILALYVESLPRCSIFCKAPMCFHSTETPEYDVEIADSGLQHKLYRVKYLIIELKDPKYQVGLTILT